MSHKENVNYGSVKTVKGIIGNSIYLIGSIICIRISSPAYKDNLMLRRIDIVSYCDRPFTDINDKKEVTLNDHTAA